MKTLKTVLREVVQITITITTASVIFYAFWNSVIVLFGHTSIGFIAAVVSVIVLILIHKVIEMVKKRFFLA